MVVELLFECVELLVLALENRLQSRNFFSELVVVVGDLFQLYLDFLHVPLLLEPALESALSVLQKSLFPLGEVMALNLYFDLL